MQVKLLDYGRVNPFGQIVGRPKNLAWPVRAYRVTMPQMKNDSSCLNPFEILILKFLTVDPHISDLQLKEATCLPEDLLHGIICRLQDRGFLDQYRAVVEEKKKEWQNALEVTSDNYITAIVFQDVYSNKLLPFLHYINDRPLKKITDEDVLKSHKRLSFDFNKEFAAPTPLEVIVAIREMKALESHRNQETASPRLQQIRVLSKPEICYLTCPIAIQQSDGDFRIADPFDRGYSSLLEKVFSEVLEKDSSLYDWFKNWQKSLHDESYINNNERRYPFDTPALRNKFPALIQNLIPARGKEYRSIRKIYASLEWALYYFCKQFSYESSLGILELTSQIEMPNKLAKISRELGFNKYVPGFCYVKPGKIIDFRNGQAEMPMGIALLLMLSKESPVRLALLKISKKYPDFFDRIHEIKSSRDRIEHGSVKNFSDTALTNDVFMTDVVSILHPEINFDNTARQESNHVQFFDQNFAGRIYVQEYYGIGVFNKMGENLQQRLISAESFWCDLRHNLHCDDAMPFVCNLYAATQIAFKKHLYRNLPPDILDSEILTTAEKKATDAGFSKIPERIRGTRVSMVRQTIQSQDQTLGAAVLAFLIIADTENLTMIYNRQPDFLDAINEIIMARGHGNQILPLAVKDVEKLRKITYTTIKTLLEV